MIFMGALAGNVSFVGFDHWLFTKCAKWEFDQSYEVKRRAITRGLLLSSFRSEHDHGLFVRA